MDAIKQEAYSIIIVAVSIGMIGILTPDGVTKRSIRVLCGVVLAIVLLSPLLSFVGGLSSQIPDEEVEDGAETNKNAYELAIDQKLFLLEESLKKLIKTQWEIESTRVTLKSNNENPASIVLISATVETEAVLSEALKSQIISELSQILECEVKILDGKQNKP